MQQSLNEMASKYFSRLKAALADVSLDKVSELAESIKETGSRGGTIWIAGNGGSASTANHMAVDLSFGVKPNGSLRAVSLSESSSSITATGNDIQFDEIFSRQIESLARPGDLVILISASGNSSNLLMAAEAANIRWVKTAAIIGFDGGKLASIVGQAIITPTEMGDYGVAEDLHLAVNHCLKEILTNGS